MSIRLSILIVFSIVVLIYTIRNPFVGAWYFLFLDIFKPTIMANIPAGYINLHLPLIVGTVTIISMLLKKGSLTFRKKDFLLIALFVIVLFSWIINKMQYPFDYNIDLLKMILFYFMLSYSVDSEDRMNKILWTIVLCETFLAVLGWYNERSGIDYRAIPYSTMNKNDPALEWAITFPLCLYFLFKKEYPYWIKLLLMSCMTFISIANVRSLSRSGTITLVFVACLSILPRKKYGLLLIPLAIFAFYSMPSRAVDRMQSVENFDKDSSFMGRVMAWKAGVEMAKDNPLFGVGFKQFAFNTYKYLPPEAEKYMSESQLRIMSPHNIYIRIAGECGFLGVAAFMWFILCNLKDCWYTIKYKGKSTDLFFDDNNRATFFVGVSFLGILFYGLVGSAQVYLFNFLMLSGLITANWRITNQKTSVEVSAATNLKRHE